MRKTAVDYRGFKISKVNNNEYKHLLYLLGWPVYFLMYFLTEQIIPAENCYSVHCFLDDIVPFCEWFVIPYVGWYLLIVGSLIYFALYNPDNFKGMMKFIIVTQIVAMAIYIIFPNRQDLRPEVFPRDNILTDCVRLLYSLDTNTNVCPSLHVAFSIGIASTWLKEKNASIVTKVILVAFCLSVCLSVAFVKQHSVVDIFAALPMCLLAEFIAFNRTYFRKNRRLIR